MIFIEKIIKHIVIGIPDLKKIRIDDIIYKNNT